MPEGRVKDVQSDFSLSHIQNVFFPDKKYFLRYTLENQNYF